MCQFDDYSTAHSSITDRNYQIIKLPNHQIDFMNKVGAYIKDSYKELVEKVTWPNWDNLQQSTMIVLGATLVITALVALMDFVCNGAFTQIYKLF